MVGHYTEETGWRNNNILKSKLFAEYFAMRDIFETNSQQHAVIPRSVVAQPGSCPALWRGTTPYLRGGK